MYHNIFIVPLQHRIPRLLLVRFIEPIIQYTEDIKSKEENLMKTRKYKNPYTRPTYRYSYPNEADRSYFVERFVNGATAVVSCMGIVVMLLFLITM